jgi:2-polyprenyl-3-methyl-5-hydroxy-6-metoxy-1,4-benzoquinol methylase
MSKVAVVRVERSRMEALIERLGHEDTPRVYVDRNVLVRELFWRRLSALLALAEPPSRGRALDFGGGNGVLAPTLARLYREVVVVDLRTEMAEELRRADGLANVTVRRGELSTLGLPDGQVDTLVAADVLEHVAELAPLVGELERLLKPGGELLVSAPTENRFYELGRRVFRYTKPDDHYHTAAYIEHVVNRRLPLRRRRYFPVNLGPLAAFALARFVKSGASP